MIRIIIIKRMIEITTIMTMIIITITMRRLPGDDK